MIRITAGLVNFFGSVCIIISAGMAAAAIPDIDQFVKNMENKGSQEALIGEIDSLVIARPNVEFRLGPGKLAILDFGASRPCAMVYEGKGRFKYTPPNEVERYQLQRLAKKDSLDNELQSISIYFNTEFDNLSDTSAFVRQEMPKEVWNRHWEGFKDAFEYAGIYIVNFLAGDLLVDRPGSKLYADFDLKGIGHLAFVENPESDDHYTLIEFKRRSGSKVAEVIAGFSKDNTLRSQRGVFAVDVTHYDIRAEIENNGNMTVTCGIDFNPLRWGVRFIYFNWYMKNEIVSVHDSSGFPLTFIAKKNESGFAIIYDEPLEIGRSERIEIEFECNSVKSVWGVYYIQEQTKWYPQYDINDRSTYELEFITPKNLEVLSCGVQYESFQQDDRNISRWRLDYPVYFVSFNLGDFESKQVSAENIPPVKSYLSKEIPHSEMALYLAAEGTLSSADMVGTVATDVTNSLAFFTSIFGPCPFDTIRATEIPYLHGQGTPGLILLSWSTFQTESIAGTDEKFRAHEVAHQWWGNMVGWESYRDYWLIEALAEYSGFWFYQLSSKNKSNCDNILNLYRQHIFSGGSAGSVGAKAGPMAIGRRLIASDPEDYAIVVYEKGAYFFHMIRYLLHDYKTGSDDAFAAFLKDLVDSYKGKIITTPLLLKLLEKHIGSDMAWFFDQWVYGTAVPEYEFSYKSTPTDDGKFSVVCHVVQSKVPDDFGMLVPITVLFEEDRYIHLKLWIDMPEADINLPNLPFEPKKIIFNTYDAVLCRVDYK